MLPYNVPTVFFVKNQVSGCLKCGCKEPKLRTMPPPKSDSDRPRGAAASPTGKLDCDETFDTSDTFDTCYLVQSEAEALKPWSKSNWKWRLKSDLKIQTMSRSVGILVTLLVTCTTSDLQTLGTDRDVRHKEKRRLQKHEVLNFKMCIFFKWHPRWRWDCLHSSLFAAEFPEDQDHRYSDTLHVSVCFTVTIVDWKFQNPRNTPLTILGIIEFKVTWTQSDPKKMGFLRLMIFYQPKNLITMIEGSQLHHTSWVEKSTRARVSLKKLKNQKTRAKQANPNMFLLGTLEKEVFSCVFCSSWLPDPLCRSSVLTDASVHSGGWIRLDGNDGNSIGFFCLLHSCIGIQVFPVKCALYA